ncbi:unnamed protein product [Periconia digitata]|uniref:F-box domain-containing protein n=1 Tax=Periconia digitata TaxID=1303443 RepID=A0A9W4UTJ1_9PLEO|nr:unnamed protein product [Periconia digitata]
MIILTQPPVMVYEDEHPPPYRVSTFNRSDSVPRKCAVPVRKPSLLRTPSHLRTSEETRASRLASAPWELTRRKTRLQLRRTQSSLDLPMNIFRKLPREVYECILLQLENMHLGRDGQGCSQCYVRDLYHLCLTSRSWDRVANPRMYRDLWVLGSDDSASHMQVKIIGTSRLKLLRRTLRERPTLAQLVRNLHMPDFQDLYHNAAIEREEIVNLVASLVMACPRLERLIGFHIPYTHSCDRLSYALSTRPSLKERVWLLSEDDGGIAEDQYEDDSTEDYYHAATDPTERFLGLNYNHPDLTSLVLHQDSIHTSRELNFRAIIGTLRQFPKLRNLSLSGLSKTAFSNFTLNALPTDLVSLRLENLPGINDTGLERFSTSRTVKTLQSITLINLEISRLDIICNFLHPRLSKLHRFSLIQYRTPLVTSNRGIWLRPHFHSPTLKYLHWEIRSQAGPPPSLTTPNTTTTTLAEEEDPTSHLTNLLLATSIRKGISFPSLQRIRIPHDPSGLLQAQCKPLTSALLPSDTHLFTTTSPSPSPHSSLQSASKPNNHKRLPSRTDSPTSPLSSNPTTPLRSFPHLTRLTPSRSRLAAQSRILAANTPRQKHRAVESAAPPRSTKPPSFMGLGEPRSRVVYDVRSDREALGLFVGDEDDQGYEGEGDAYGLRNEWVVGVEDLVGRWEGGGEGYGGNSVRRGCWVVGHHRGGDGGVGVGRVNCVGVEDLF